MDLLINNGISNLQYKYECIYLFIKIHTFLEQRAVENGRISVRMGLVVLITEMGHTLACVLWDHPISEKTV